MIGKLLTSLGKKKVDFLTSFAEHYNRKVVKTGKIVFPGHWHVDRGPCIRGDLGKHFFKNKKIAETPGSGGRVRKHLIFQQ